MEKDSKAIQRTLNVQKKNDLEALYGAKYVGEATDLPPEDEADWLDYIAEFERQCEANGRISVRDFMGDPLLPTLASIPALELHETLQRVLALLLENSIEIHFDREVTDAEAYRFITDELFEVEIDNVRIEGLHDIFVYSEFHPEGDHRRNEIKG